MKDIRNCNMAGNRVIASIFSVPLYLLFALNFILASCNDNSSGDSTSIKDSAGTPTNADTSNSARELKPAGPAPAWAPDIKPEMLVVIEKLGSYNAPPFYTLTPQEARKQPSPATAVMDVMKEHNIPMPAPGVDTSGMEIPVTGGKIHLRIYTPKTGNGPFPVIVYYHGGGWVIADLDTYNASATALAEQTGAVLVSVAYRQAPEHKFPTAHNDSYAAYQWVVKNAASIKGDTSRIAVAGESAGGNLAASVSMMARDKGMKIPVHQLLVYPIAAADMNTESYQKNDTAKPLNKPGMQWFFKHYLPNKNAASSPMISLVKANLKGLPATTIITASIDPLQTEGQQLGDKLKSAGVEVSQRNFEGVTHEFFGMGTVVPQARDAQSFAAGELKKAFGN
ncbi:MAG TPA: alpha/beta hydrolase [Flavitalea sp.]|nr:alpha/beta hydrolase [Flavitalea sp.]